MPELDALVGSYQHLERLPRAADASHTLRKVASLVKPIMRNRKWRVGTLKEFYPEQANLLGINSNNGESICLRLRHSGDENQFIPLEQVVDTMLHELSHNVHGPHNNAFHKLWNDLRDEYTDLKMKGYSGEGFLSDGRRLGGRGVPVTELRRRARAEAEKRRSLAGLKQGSGQKLGGQPIMRGVDMRNVIANAVASRNNITDGCYSGTSAGEQASKEADRNGFRTKAEESDANDRAIAQALWELIQEEEALKAGLEPPERTKDPSHPPEDGSSSKARPSAPSKQVPPVPTATRPLKSSAQASRPPQPSRPQSRVLGGDLDRRKRPHTSRLISEDEEKRRKAATSASASVAVPAPQPEPSEWACKVCTLINPITYLACDACGSERPTMQQGPAPSSGPSLLGWNCQKCGTFLEHQWWVCNVCGKMKDSSSVSV